MFVFIAAGNAGIQGRHPRAERAVYWQTERKRKEKSSGASELTGKEKRLPAGRMQSRSFYRGAICQRKAGQKTEAEDVTCAAETEMVTHWKSTMYSVVHTE